MAIARRRVDHGDAGVEGAAQGLALGGVVGVDDDAADEATAENHFRNLEAGAAQSAGTHCSFSPKGGFETPPTPAEDTGGYGAAGTFERRRRIVELKKVAHRRCHGTHIEDTVSAHPHRAWAGWIAGHPGAPEQGARAGSR